MPPADQSHPFATFPVAGKGLRPYFTPGLTSDNYTTFSGGQMATPVPYYANEHDDLIDSRAAARELVNYTVLKFITTAMSCPFDVSKTLLQVQYMPHEDAEVVASKSSSSSDEHDQHKEYNEAEFSEEEDDENDDFYGTGDTTMNTAASFNHDDPEFKQHMDVDASGYVIRKSVYDDATRPSYQLKSLDAGVWQGIGRLMKQPHEGWRALFKGQYTNWLFEIAHLFFQPTLEGVLNDVFDLYDDTIPLVHLDRVGPNLATLVGSNLIVGFLLSPLELIRTRLVVQSSSPLYRKYRGPLHALKTILAEEGGLRGLYLSSHHLIPTILYHTITPLLQNTTPLIIDRLFKISANDSPFLYSLAELGLNTLEVVITLPLDTIRKRMQCQIRSRVPGKKRFAPVVALRPVPYTGVMDACYRIVKEEGGRRKKGKKRGLLTGMGLRGLYQGFGMQCSSNVILFVLHAINGVEDDYEDF
ncbi:hypothetical protein INT45_013440 [Circinella minor]|uniref:Mitochondrial carrier n=1 Tax=Circinella minor TaxID=1195481 RepID=A0A8H7S8H5_9FUNG|nr:hypothetical protein INT45_013440 [Circinella minor]